MGFLTKVFGTHNADDGGMLAGFNPAYNVEQGRDTLGHYRNALTFRKNPFEEAFKANWHFTRAHPGALAARNIVQDKWGLPIEENANKLAVGAGGVLGGVFGPIAGGIGGGAAGWGLGSQFGDEGSYKSAYRGAGQGAAAGVAGGYLGNLLRGGITTSSGNVSGPMTQTFGSSTTPVVSSGAGLGGEAVLSAPAGSQGAGLGGPAAASKGSFLQSLLGGGGSGGNSMWGNLAQAAIGGGLNYWENLEKKKAMQPDINAREAALAKYRQFLENPRAMYDDPGLAAMREQRMDDVRGQQLAQTGGLRGGAYSRALMKEGSAFDRAMMQQQAQNYMGMLSATAPTMSAYIGNAGGAAQAGQSALDDYRFMQMMDSFRNKG